MSSGEILTKKEKWKSAKLAEARAQRDAARRGNSSPFDDETCRAILDAVDGLRLLEGVYALRADGSLDIKICQPSAANLRELIDGDVETIELCKNVTLGITQDPASRGLKANFRATQIVKSCRPDIYIELGIAGDALVWSVDRKPQPNKNSGKFKRKRYNNTFKPKSKLPKPVKKLPARAEVKKPAPDKRK